jgi:hypothetical protein
MTRASDAVPTLDDDLPPDNPLTTKEGWGALVRHAPEPPTLLSTEKLAALPHRRRVDYDQMLRDYHADLSLVNTRSSRRSIFTGRFLVQLNRWRISGRRGIAISGASGTGKTTVSPSSVARTNSPSANASPLTRPGYRSPTSPSHRRPHSACQRSSSPGSSGWSSAAATTSPTSPRRSAPLPRPPRVLSEDENHSLHLGAGLHAAGP